MADQSKVQAVTDGLFGFEPSQVDVQKYTHQFGGRVLTWEADPWYDVCRSWYETSYIHGGISGDECTVTGPDAQQLLSDLSINNVWKWRLNRCKHLVMCDEKGLVLNHALFMRDGEQTFRTTAGNDLPMFEMVQKNPGKYNVEFSTRKVFVFQFSGPSSLTIIEAITKTNLHDMKFLETRPVTIPGVDDPTLEACRIGMSGTLSYEIRGAQEAGPAVYQRALEVGKPLGLKRLGWRSYPVNHTYGGNAQMTCTFETAYYGHDDFPAPWPMVCTGSVEPENMRARFRTPAEGGWSWMADFNHDFVGRDKVEAEAANPKRKIVSLKWNVEDIQDVYASLWQEDEEPYKYMEFPAGQQEPAGGHQDYITTLDGKVVGYSATPIYSSWWRTTISESIIDVEYAEEGTELLVQWGDYGHRIKNIRATVERYPYSNVESNKTYDIAEVPYGMDLG